MKKLGKKLSFLTKVLLVVGLLISNLSSLSVVFAYEDPMDLVISLNGEKLEISYNKQLTDEVKEVDVKVYENYTYLDGMKEEEVVSVYSLTEDELLAAVDGSLELTYNSIFALEEEIVSNYKLFDGTYSARVELLDVTVYEDETDSVEDLETETDLGIEDDSLLQTTEVIDEPTTPVLLAEGTYEYEFSHEKGLNIRLFDLSNDSEINLVDGKYSLSSSVTQVEVVAQILSGGLNPTDVFEYEGEEYLASELLAKGFSSKVDFSGRLFGEYEIPVQVGVVKVLPIVEDTSELMSTDEMIVSENLEDIANDNHEEVVYTDSVNVLYGTYQMNADVLNDVSNDSGYGDTYLFYNDSKDGILYVLSELEEVQLALEETVVTRTMLDLYNILNVSLEVDENEEQLITYKLLKDDVDVLESFVPVTEEDTLEKYLSTIMLDDSVNVLLVNDGLTITYSVVVVGDLNNDNLVTQEDVAQLIEQYVKNDISNLDKVDVYGHDGKLNSFDVLYLNQVVASKKWDADIVQNEVVLNSRLDVYYNDELLSDTNYLTSGDVFDVNYVLSVTDYEVNGISGLFKYDESLFELVSLDVINDWLGNSHEGKFLYLGDESLTGPELEDELPEDDTTTSEEDVVGENVDGSLDEESGETVSTVDYVVVNAKFRALSATNEESNNVISLEEIELYNSSSDGVTYYVLDSNAVSTEKINVVASSDNTLSYLEIAGVIITLEDGVYEYEVNVTNDVTLVDLKYILSNVAANVTSTIYPEELVEGSNTIVVTVTSENGISQNYTITVIREVSEKETTTQVSNNYYYEDDKNDEPNEVVTTPSVEEDDEEVVEEESNVSRIVLIVLILLVIAGLVYLIFKDDEDEEVKKANKDINRLKKESLEPKEEPVVKMTNKTANKNSSKSTNNKNTSSKTKRSSNRKER